MSPAPRSLGRRLRFQQLELVNELAASGSLGSAAERLHVSRAAVSKALREMEATLGTQLFVRSARGMAPTAAGLRVASHARLMLHELDHLSREVGASAGAATPQTLLRIGMPPFVAAMEAPDVLARLAARFAPQGLSLQLVEGRLNALVEQLLQGEVDAVLALYSAHAVEGMDLSMLAMRHFRAAPMVVVAAPALGVPRRRRHEWAELRAHPWVLPPPSTHLRRSMDEMFAATGARAPRPAVESASLAANVQLAVAGLGLAVVPARAARAEIDAGRLRVLEMRQPLPPTTVALMYRKVSAIYLEAVQALDEVAASLASSEG